MVKNKIQLRGFLFAITASSILSGCGGGESSTPILEDYIVPVEVAPTKSYYLQQITSNAIASYDAGFAGAGVTVAVLDSGVNVDHVDFTDSTGASRIDLANSTGFSTNATTGLVEETFEYVDTINHGTHVSSIAIGKEYGLAPEATLLQIKVVKPDGYTDTDVVTAGMERAAPLAPIINASISGMVNLLTFGSSDEYNRYVTALSTNDSSLVVAAGNSNVPVGAYHFEDNNIVNASIDPALANRVLNVISVDSAGVRSSFSNYPGTCADVTVNANIPCDAAVMTQIQNNFISAYGNSTQAADYASTTGTIYLGGTSMAAPVVSGSLALLMSNWDQLLITDAVRILKETADNTFAWYTPEEYGVGTVDVAAAMAPVGVLKSASTGGTASYTPSDSAASIPSSLASIKSIPALKNVAFFDDYSRDYAVDLTQMIQVDKVAVDWNSHWNNVQMNDKYTSHSNLGKSSLAITYDATQRKPFKALSLTGDGYQVSMGSVNALDGGISALNPLAKNFTSTSNVSGETLALKADVANGVALLGGVKWENGFTTTDGQTADNRQTQLALSYSATDNLNIGVGVEWRNEQNGVADLQGNGLLSFGENNTTQLNVLSANYKTGDSSFYSLFKFGALTDSSSNGSSYISLNNATLGQTVLGFNTKLGDKSSFGAQAYNPLSILKADMTLNVPVGVDSNGVTQYASESFSHESRKAV